MNLYRHFEQDPRGTLIAGAVIVGAGWVIVALLWGIALRRASGDAR